MISEKRSRSRRRWKTDDPAAGESTVDRLEYASYSFDNETANLIGNRASVASGKTGNGRTSDESEVRADSDNLTYTKDAPEATPKIIASPVSSIRKVEEYLTKQEEPETDQSADDDRARNRKRRKSKTKRRDENEILESARIADEDASDENKLLVGKREIDSSVNHQTIKQKRRKWQKIQKEKNRVMEFREIIVGGDARNEDETESGSPKNYSARENRRKSRDEGEERIRVLESIGIIGDVDEIDRTAEIREDKSPENNLESREKRRSNREAKEMKNRVSESEKIEENTNNDDDSMSEIREDESLKNNPEIRDKQRKSSREDSGRNRIPESTEKIAENAYDDNGGSSERRDSESPENDRRQREKRRKSRKERKSRLRNMASSRQLDEDDDGRSSERRQSGSPGIRERKPRNRFVSSSRQLDEQHDDGRSNEKRDDAAASPDIDADRRRNRRKSRKSRKEKSRSLDSTRTINEDGDDDDDDDDAADLRPKSRKSPAAEEPRIPRRRKRRRSKADSSSRKSEKSEKELPITEILRKAQENSRNRHDEPVPLAELTTDTIYVQGRRGFSAVKLAAGRNARDRRGRSPTPVAALYPIKVAIAAQTVWNSTGLVHQGLLAGMALMHFILIQTFFELSLDFLLDYSLIAELYSNIFSFLVTMCVISVFDKFDLAHLDLAHLREIYVEHSRSFLAVPLYLTVFFLHQATLLVSDKVALMSYAGNTTGFESNSTQSIVEEDLVTWQKVNLAKDGLAVLAWLFVALGPREDMLLTHLKTMEKYADSPESSRRDIAETMRRREHEKQSASKKTIG